MSQPPSPPQAPFAALSTPLVQAVGGALHRWEVSGTSLVDSGSSPLAAQLGGSATVANGAVFFPSSGSPSVHLPNLPFGGTDASLSCWFFASELRNYAKVWFLWSGQTAADGYSVRGSWFSFDVIADVSIGTMGGFFLSYTSETQGLVADVDNLFTVGSWVHITQTMEASGAVRLYLNGAFLFPDPVYYITSFGTGLMGASLIYTGAYLGGPPPNTGIAASHFHGYIASFQIYDRALTASEVGKLARGQVRGRRSCGALMRPSAALCHSYTPLLGK